MARAVATRAMFVSGHDSAEAMAARLGARQGHLAVLLRLSYRSPEIVRAILAGQHPVELTPTRLIALSRRLWEPVSCKALLATHGSVGASRLSRER